MCKYCEGRRRERLIDRTAPSENSLDTHIFRVSIGKGTLQITLIDSVYDPRALDDDGDFGRFELVNNINKRIKIKYCPMCGRKLTEE